MILAYAWIAYPLLLLLCRNRADSPSTCDLTLDTNDKNYLISVVIAAHNEEAVIRSRIENILNHAVPDGVKLQVLVGSDGSTDMTVATALEFEMNYKNIKVFEYQEQRGKVAVLKDLVREARKRGEDLTEGNEGNEGGMMGSVLMGFGERVARPLPPPCLGVAASEDGSLDARDKTDGELVGSGEKVAEEILVFTDANTEFQEGAIEKLLRHFDDPDVGGVCGKLIFREAEDKQTTDPASSKNYAEASDGPRTTEPLPRGVDGTPNNQQLNNSTSAPSSEGAYWRWESAMKERESALGSCLGANGAIYAIRAECFWADVPDNAVVDDFVIGMKVREQGKRMVFEPEAVAYEEYPDVRSEWGRRVRIGAGDYQALVWCRKCLLPWYGSFAWSFLSHKVLRWLTPHMLILLLGLSFFSTGRQGGYYVVHGMILLFICMLVGKLMRDSELKVARFFRLCDYFVMMQAALFVGFVKFCKGDLSGAWSRTPRSGNIYHGAGTSSDP